MKLKIQTMNCKQTRRASRSVLTIFASLGLASSAHAAVLLSPTGVVNTNGGNLGGRGIEKTIDGSGMFDSETGGDPVAITTANVSDVYSEIAGVNPNNFYWISGNIGSANFSTVELTFDLGESFDDVDRVHLWNYSAGNSAPRALKTLDISFSSDGVNFTSGVALTFADTPGNVRPNADTVSFDAVSDVQYIRLTNFTNQGDDNYLAFHEIRFGAIPEPSAALLGGLGLLCLLRRKR